MRIWSDSPAKWFEESHVIGNGTLGASVYNGFDADSLSLNDLTLWTGEPSLISKPFSPDAASWIPKIREALKNNDYKRADSLQRYVQGKYSQNYQPLGKLVISYTGVTPTHIYRELDINRGVASSIVMEGEQVARIVQAFCSAPDSIIAVNITNLIPAEATIMLTAAESMQTVMSTATATKGYAAYDSRPVYSRGEGSFRYDSGRGVHFLTIMDIECPEGGDITYTEDRAIVKEAPVINIRLTNATSFKDARTDPGTDTN
ncbi:MAG: glycoside hydrolase family 95 protein [Muribaculaceae bacterium]|nr:glycoside hydrolase family 95 protein [Muribaculaceae bacterium]